TDFEAEPVNLRSLLAAYGAILAPQSAARCGGAVESVVTLLEADDDARGTAARADSVSTRSGQDVMAATVVPAHQIGLDGLLTEYSGHRNLILSVRSRNVAMGVDLR